MCSGVDVDGPGAGGTSNGGDFDGASATFFGSGTSILVWRMGLEPTVYGVCGGSGDSRGGTNAAVGEVAGIRASIRSSHSCAMA
jgi:hypothetical protein